MADIDCAVCREPWDAWGARHGDMEKWEYDLFRQGAGCPCCTGVVPDGEDAEENELAHLKQIVFDSGITDDPDNEYLLMQRLGEVGSGKKRPEWKRPDPIVHETCAGCNLQIVTSPETGKRCYDNTHVKRAYWAQAYYGTQGYEFLRDEDAEPESFVKVDERSDDVYCQACTQLCDECGEVRIFTRTELQGDAYDAGSSFPHPHNYHDSICVNCLENLPSEDDDEDELVEQEEA